MTTQTPPNWFKWLSIGAIIWNLIGVLAFVGTMMITPEMLAELPEGEQALHNNTPLWAHLAFGVAVFAGLAGSISLLMKKAVALMLFIVSVVAVLIQMFHAYGMADAFAVTGVGGLILPLLIIFIAVDLAALSVKAKTKGWIS